MPDHLFRSIEPPAVATVILYGKPACPLCDEAEVLVQQVAKSKRLQIQKIDVTTDLDLYRRYGLEIPVLELPGGRELHWPFSANDILAGLGST